MSQPSLFGGRKPLAEVLRPQRLEDFVGQQGVIGPGTPLRNLFASGQLTSLLFWGPPGVGKTTLARIIAGSTPFVELSAVNSGLKELREAMAGPMQKVVFIDEIHRYSKTQQDALLPYVEIGSVILMGATTENPSFQVIPALLSRMLIVRLEALSQEAMAQVLTRGAQHLGRVPMAAPVLDYIIRYANGDARSALNLLDIAHLAAGTEPIAVPLLESLAQQSRMNHDEDSHYDLASAYQKSLRGGDANAAIYWLARLIAGGEDPRFIARRLLVTASEDTSQDPTAVLLASAAVHAVEFLGMPEARIALAQATIYVAQAPKCNRAICAVDAALADIQHHGHCHPVPVHLRDAHYSDAKRRYGHGVGYVYTHDAPDVPQTFLPDALKGKNYVDP
jgi:putative ATPase